MRYLPTIIPRSRFVALLLFYLPIWIVGGLLSATAQEAGSLPEVSTEPVPANFQNRIPSDQLAFLKDYAGKPAKLLMKDKRYRALLKLVTPRTEYHYGRDMPLRDANDEVMDGSSLPVQLREDRYVTVAGRQGPILDGKGMLWFDLQEGIGLGAVYFHPTNGEPTPTVAIFSRQLTQQALGMSELPLGFASDEIQWATQVGIAPVTVRYFIPEDGKKYVLVHDEDYCDHLADQPAPPEAVCQPLNADAADADMNGAYFMAQTHNQANATAWMLGPDQVAWLSLREQSCRVGPDRLGCRIHITRERTRQLLGGRPIPHFAGRR